MKFVRNMEQFFEKYIEGFFDKKLAGGLQPVEIAKYLARVMENERSVGVSRIYVPNQYFVYLQSEDLSRIAPYRDTICEDVSTFLTKEAKRNGYTMLGKPLIELKLAEATRKGRFYGGAAFTEPVPISGDVPEIPASGELGNTRVFDKVALVAPGPRSRLTALAVVTEGGDAGLRTEVGMNRVNIGRREGNEIPLTDLNTSRLHAYIIFDEGGHVLYDAKSLNGTYVNEHRVTRKRLQAGDKIRIGNTIIVYEVK
jgi:hypothetical protein